MNKRSFYSILLALLLAIAACLFYFYTQQHKEGARPDPITVGFITPSDHLGGGFSAIHYQACQKAADLLDARLLVKSNIPESEGKLVPAVEELISQGAQLIILNSYAYSKEARQIISDHPGISFYSMGPHYNLPNLSSYMVRHYQGSYLAGLTAGMMTKTGQVGYVAAYPINEVQLSINAFALGLRKTNPQAELEVIYTYSWDNRAKETDAVQKLYRHGIDFISYHQNKTNVVQAAEELGLMSIAFHAHPEETFSPLCLTTIVSEQTPIYLEIIHNRLLGRSNEKKYLLLGCEQQAVDLEPFSPLVPQKVIDEVGRAKAEFIRGKQLFINEIRDNQGRLHCRPGESMSDLALIQTDWLLEGVKIYDES